MLMLAFPRNPRGRLARIWTKVRVGIRFLVLPILAFIMGLFWETIDWAIGLASGALGIQVFILLFKPFVRVSAGVVNEVQRIKRLRACTNTTSDELPLNDLRKWKLCPGSGRSASSEQDWQEGQCQHCLEAIDSSNGRIVDHLLPQVYVGLMPVECDPRLVPILRRRCSNDQRRPPWPLAGGEDWSIRMWPNRPNDPASV